VVAEKVFMRPLQGATFRFLADALWHLLICRESVLGSEKSRLQAGSRHGNLFPKLEEKQLELCHKIIKVNALNTVLVYLDPTLLVGSKGAIFEFTLERPAVDD
jgi:hypothetical protein